MLYISRRENVLPQSLKILRFFFNKRRLTGKDFLELCRANKITLQITSDCRRGMYYCVNGQHFITLSADLPRKEREHVGWHEFAHFLENYYECKAVAAFSNVEPNNESEKLADAFANICMGLYSMTGPMDFVKMLMRTKR
jgi:hypothetical protein